MKMSAPFALIFYLIGLVLLLNSSHFVWFAFGIFLPIIPWFYTVWVILEKWGVLGG